MKLSVIIPMYNEVKSAPLVLSEVLEYCARTVASYEIIAVDDGSSDGTADLLDAFHGIHVIHIHPNRGKGYAVKQGILASQGEYVLFMDADNSTEIVELDHFMREIQEYDMIIGSRALKESYVPIKQNIIKRILGRLANTCIRMLLGLPFRDTQCGFKLMRSSVKEVVKQLTIDRWGFDFELLFLASRKGFKIHESPVTWRNNFDSKVTFQSYVHSLVQLVMVRYRYIIGAYH